MQLTGETTSKSVRIAFNSSAIAESLQHLLNTILIYSPEVTLIVMIRSKVEL